MSARIITVAGTRPELIRLSLIIKKLDAIPSVKHTLVYTNQNYADCLSTIFFDELGIRKPDYVFDKQDSLGSFLGNAFEQFEKIIEKELPTKVLILGDTNSGLVSIIANRYNLPVYHMEAGNRCFDDRVPEESNRRVIDNLAAYNLPYTENSRQNLLSEGFHKNKVLKTGNPIYEVLDHYSSKIDNSDILNKLDIRPDSYVLVTAHRAENVDDKRILTNIMMALSSISLKYKVIFSVHPRTQSKLFGLTFDKKRIIVSEPFGFFDFVKLEKNAKLVISDSGTVQEECCLFGVPSLTIRESTERHETIECGSNILTGTGKHNIVRAFETMLEREVDWTPPEDYLIKNVSDIVINILLGKS